MDQLESVEALVHLEDEMPDVLFESAHGSGIHIWPLIRVALGLRSANKELGSGAVHGGWSRGDTVRRLWGLAAPNRFHSVHSPRDRDLLIVAGGATSRPTADGRENWLVDAFAGSAGGNALVLQDRDIPSRPTTDDKPLFGETLTLRDAYLRVLLKSKLRPLAQDNEVHIRSVVREILRKYQFEVDESLAFVLEGAAVQNIRRARHWQREFERILARASPNLVLLDNASYMTKAAVTRTIRQFGVPIAEPQHGWIGPSHAAYNYGRAFFEPELRPYLPDTLLTFGEFWTEGIRHPGKLIAIGKPYLERASTSAARRGIPKRQVLVTSSIYRTDELIRLSLSLRDLLPDTMTVAVRPHPSERPRVDSLYADLADQERIHLDLEPDPYLSFAQSAAVIGYASTVLFEALAFDIPAFVIDSPLANLYAPTSVFGERIAAGGPYDQLAALILRRSQGDEGSSKQGSLNRIWKTDAVENFRRFLNSMGAFGPKP